MKNITDIFSKGYIIEVNRVVISLGEIKGLIIIWNMKNTPVFPYPLMMIL